MHIKEIILKIESTILFGQFNQSKNIRNQKYFNWWEKLQGFVFFIFYFILLDMFIEGEKSLSWINGKDWKAWRKKYGWWLYSR